jgi:ATP-binding cassette subfamily C (CFTR/MRP) protein 1
MRSFSLTSRLAFAVTHALHILPEVDFIYTVEDGKIVEEGTYVDLMAAKGPFARLLQEFGGDHAEEDEDGEDAEIAAKNLAIDNKLRRAEAMEKSAAAAGTGRLEGRLMVAEKRIKGKVSTRIYAKYLKAARGAVTAPLLLLAAFIMQGYDSCSIP